MNDTRKFNTKGYQRLLWIGVFLATVVAFVVSYMFHMSGALRAIVWIVWLAVVMSLGFFTDVGQTIFTYIKDARVELQKIVWPTRQETVQTTSIVILMVGITGIVLWGLDISMVWVIGKITHLG